MGMFDEMKDYADRNWGWGLGIEEDFEDPFSPPKKSGKKGFLPPKSLEEGKASLKAEKGKKKKKRKG